MEYYKQVKMRCGSNTYTMGWIPEASAKMGMNLTLKEDEAEPKAIWKVIEVFPNRIPKDEALLNARDHVKQRKFSDI